ncbi:hypothetical protein IB237_26070 [Agrobacterium sp. AGB01]|uniref:hypothetical protein n=1 Tax=Agrobacterium sp. AGB01 TaxID=2769302 RepID=UPI001782150F|nr:hypothetical protein [Agrobacterium sp. AGB01]MBD9390668.1 hypothetical protein [Agrobacterium sp. AGB01]
MYVVGASLEQHGAAGQSGQSRYGYAPLSAVNWANELDAARIFDSNVLVRNGSYPYFNPPTNYAQSGSGWALQGGGTRPSIVEQIDALLIVLAAAPVGSRIAYLTGGRNEIDTITVEEYMVHFNREYARLLPVSDLVAVPLLWLRSTSSGGSWVSGGSSRQKLLDINAAIAATVAGNPKTILVNLLDVVNEATGDRNPKAGYTQSDGIHFSAIGAKAAGAAIRAAIISRLTIKSFGGFGTNIALPLSGTGGSLTNAIGVAADGYSLVRAGAGPTVEGSKDGNVQVVTVTRAASHTPVWSGFSFTLPDTGRISVPAGGKYRARAKIVIEPTAVPVSLAFFMSEFISTTVVQRAVGRWHMVAGGETPTEASSAASMQNIDATNGLTLWVETPDLSILSSGVNITLATYLQVATQQGAAATVVTRIENLEITAA